MDEPPRLYVSYLLRLWQAETGGRLTWRASLENPQTGKVKVFGHSTDLYAFLDQEMTRRDLMKNRAD